MNSMITIASGNAHKVEELRVLLGEGAWTLSDVTQISDYVAPAETGDTFTQNAILKADACAQACAGWAMADDSGLVVDVLGGAPGVWSARYAGEPCNDLRNNQKLLSALINVPLLARTARYVCVLALAHPERDPICIHGSCEGVIGLAPRGTAGFGYDPLFTPQGQQWTMAELSAAEKNVLSHRAQAAQKMRQQLMSLFS